VSNIKIVKDKKVKLLSVWGSGCLDLLFLTSGRVGGEWLASRPGRFTPGERVPGTNWIGGWMRPRTEFDDVKKGEFLNLPGLKLRPLCRPARSQSLYRLRRYPGSYTLYKALVCD
jgi:hypothetical protein